MNQEEATMTTPTNEAAEQQMSDGHWNHDTERAGNDRYCHTCQKWVGR